MTKVKKLTSQLVVLTLFLSLTIFGAFTILTKNVDADSPNFTTGQDTLAAKGTPEQLPSVIFSIEDSVAIKAMTSNAGTIYIGNSSANALNTGTSHWTLLPGESIELDITNLDLVWYDAETGEGLEFIVESN